MYSKTKHFSIILLFIIAHLTIADNTYLIQQLYNIAVIESPELDKIKNDSEKSIADTHIINDETYTIPLFLRYPQLKKQCSFISLGSFPTPITFCEKLSSYIDNNIQIYMKRDDLSGKKLADGTQLFGGNKVRKLEFVLADALAHGCTDTITFGCAGSNHALATTVYAHYLGMNSSCLLMNQPNSPIVRRNLLLQQYFNAKLHLYPDRVSRNNDLYRQFITHKQKTGNFPYVIPTGASYEIGALGFVNAAFELHDQIKNGIMPMPDYLYVPAGSLGTIVGLLIGVRAAQLPITIVGITTEPGSNATMTQRILTLINKTNTYLHEKDSSFPLYEWTAADINIMVNHAGPGYGKFTKEGDAAIEIVQKTEQITLDGVYSAKAFAGLLQDIKDNKLKNKVILFWHTFCGDSFHNIINTMDSVFFENNKFNAYFTTN